MIDLVCLVADRNMKAAVSTLLRRHQSLGIRPISSEIPVHPDKDHGCCSKPAQVLSSYRQDAEHALVILDHAWSGVPEPSGPALESFVKKKLRRTAMDKWAVPVVIYPELEAWVFSSSPHVAKVLGWAGRDRDLRSALEQQGLWDSDDIKPRDPKRALEWALKTARKRPRSSTYFSQIAESVSLERCQDPSFLRFKKQLQDWFPPTPRTNRDGNGTSVRPRQGDEVVSKVKTRKKLIEVAIPLDSINLASVREKAIRQGHPSSLHHWWARRPVVAARAVIFAQMIDDPSANPDRFPTEKAQERERHRLFDIIKRLVRWEDSNDQVVLEQARSEIRECWIRTCADNKNHAQAATLFEPDRLPAFHDPFAGGGALPLEAQRLGLESYASDLNPVATLINKAMIEIPPRFAGKPPVNPDAHSEFARGIPWNGKGAQGLAEDVRFYGLWIRGEAEKRIGHLYPKIEVTETMANDRLDLVRYVGQKLSVIAWIWARTVKSPNPAFSAVDVPLVSNFVLSKKKGVFIAPVVERGGYRFVVRVKMDCPIDLEVAKSGTKRGRGASFECLMSGSTISGDYIKSEGKSGRIGRKLLAVVAEGIRERVYLSPTPALESNMRPISSVWKPDIKISGSTQYIGVRPYGIERFDQLFTHRQLASLTVFSDLVNEIRQHVLAAALLVGLTDESTPLSRGGTGAHAYAEAVGVYLAFALSKQADLSNSLCRWEPNAQCPRQLFGRQAMPMIWDFAEGNPLGNSSGSWKVFVDGIYSALSKVFNSTIEESRGLASRLDAGDQSLSAGKVVSTDPPYYDNVPYADLSDFFYIWLRRTLQPVYPEIFTTLAVPKATELVAAPYRHGGKDKADQFFLRGMKNAINRLREQTHPAFPITIYYAFKQSETLSDGGNVSTGWETFLDALIRAGLSITGTLPIRTENASRLRGMASNALASSIVLVCRRRLAKHCTTSRREFHSVLRAELPHSLATLQKSNVAPVDLAQAAIGPGMAVFTRYDQVLEADGTQMSVRSALVEINRLLDETLTRQEGNLDEVTRFCIAWYEQYGNRERAYGEAEVLFKAKNTSFDSLQRSGVIVGGKGKVRLKRRDELESDWNPSVEEHVTDWECAQHLTRSLTDEQGGGLKEAARLVLSMGTAQAEKARALAYRLYSLADRRQRASEALAYNILVTSWPQVQVEVVRLATAPEQPALGLAAAQAPNLR